MKKEMDQLARKAESLEGSNSKLAQKLEVQREELNNRVQQAQFQAAEARTSSLACRKCAVGQLWFCGAKRTTNRRSLASRKANKDGCRHAPCSYTQTARDGVFRAPVQCFACSCSMRFVV